MKRFKTLIEKEDPQKARIRKIALAMGLKYKGFGQWIDPVSGEVTHSEMDGDLVPVDKKEGEDEAPSGGMGSKEGVGSSFGTFRNKQAPTGTGTNIRDIGPDGVAQAPNTDNGRWEPGPDGDNFVNDQALNKSPNDKIRPDAYVGQSNNLGWTAGSDGDNYTTYDPQSILKKALGMDVDNSPAAMREDAWDKIMRVLSEDDVTRTARGGIKPPEAKDDMIRRLQAPGDDSFNDARRALQRVGDRTRQQQMASIGKPPVVSHMGDDYEAHEYTKAIRANNKILDTPLSLRDKQRVNMMNDQARSLVQDPNFDLKQLGEELGSGSFGSVFDSPDGKAVIKQGEIGPAELIALHKMRDNPAFPNLLNAQFDTPFRDESVMSAFNDGRSVQDGTKQYDKDDQSDWDMQYPTAKGTFAMSKSAGMPLYDAIYEWSPEQKQEALKQIWKARAGMHLAGMSHGDMHGGNIMWDPETGNVNMLDLGMAQDNPMAALLEAVGGITGEDYQLSDNAGLMNFDDEGETMGGMKQRLLEMHQELEDEFAPGDDISDEANEMRDNLADLMKGGIRMKDRDLQGFQDMFPNLDGSRINKMLKKLYGNFALSDQEERMSDAFDKRQKDTRKVALANLLRKQRGEDPIEVKNPNVIPPKNMDFDSDD